MDGNNIERRRDNECAFPAVSGLQGDPTEDRPASSWWWFGFGDSKSVATDVERQPEVGITADLAREHVSKPKGVVKMNHVCRDTPKFLHPPIKNLTKEHTGNWQGVVKESQMCRDTSRFQDPSAHNVRKENVGGKQKFVNLNICKQSPRHPSSTEHGNKIYGMKVQDDRKPLNPVRKMKTNTAVNNNLRNVRNSVLKQRQGTRKGTPQQSGLPKTVTKVEKVTRGTSHQDRTERFSRPSEPPKPEINAHRSQVFNLRVGVAVLLVFHMILVQLFGCIGYSALSADE